MCISPQLRKTTCTDITYNHNTFFALSDIGLIISPNPVIESLSYTIGKNAGSMYITVMVGYCMASCNHSNVTVSCREGTFVLLVIIKY